MRKFKVIKSWPAGPKIGAELLWDVSDRIYEPGVCRGWTEEELDGFVEEIKEPEEFWYVCSTGEIVSKSQGIREYRNVEGVAKWLRFPTKEHAQAFADWMKNTYEKNSKLEGIDGFEKFADALNSRRHD